MIGYLRCCVTFGYQLMSKKVHWDSHITVMSHADDPQPLYSKTNLMKSSLKNSSLDSSQFPALGDFCDMYKAIKYVSWSPTVEVLLIPGRADVDDTLCAAIAEWDRSGIGF
jgi:hypothetical protein